MATHYAACATRVPAILWRTGKIWCKSLVARRCKKCLRPSPSLAAPKTYWSSHPTRPLAFTVIDQRNVPEDEKLAWMRQELGNDAELPEFAAKFAELFGDKVRGTVPQKAACLRLYGLYRPDVRGWAREHDLPPADQEAFRRVWGDDRKLCRECASVVGEPGKLFCSAECENAGVVAACRKCEAPLDPAWPYCAECKIGSAQPLKVPKGDTALHKGLKRGAKSLATAQRFWAAARAADPEHEPAWKKRRRSS